MTKADVQGWPDEQLMEWNAVGRRCMKLLEERLGIMLCFTVTRALPEIGPDSMASGPLDQAEANAGDIFEAKLDICCSQYGVRPLYVYPASRFGAYTDVAFMEGHWHEADVVLRARSCGKTLFGSWCVRDGDAYARSVLEYRANTYATIDAFLASGDYCLAYSGPDVNLINWGDERLHLFKLDGSLPHLCDRPEFDLRLNAVMPRFEEVRTGVFSEGVHLSPRL